MVIKTLYGTAKLLCEGNMGFDELIKRVATKGGITQEGIKVLEMRTPLVFDELFKATAGKNEYIKRTLNEEWVN